MKRKRIVVVGLLMAMAAVGTVNAQVSFIDRFGFGASYILTQAKGDNTEGEVSGNLHCIMDYLIGAYVQNIDSAIYAGLRWDFDDFDVGAMWDYHFMHVLGFSLGAGAEIFGDMDVIGNSNTGDMTPTMTPYVRVGAFLDFETMGKLGVDYTVKFNGKQTVGLYIATSAFSWLYRPTVYQAIRRTSDRDLMGRWMYGDTENGIELYFGEDFTMKGIDYEGGNTRRTREGIWSSRGDSDEYEWDPLIYINMGGRVTTWAYFIDRDMLHVRIDGEDVICKRVVE